MAFRECERDAENPLFRFLCGNRPSLSLLNSGDRIRHSLPDPEAQVFAKDFSNHCVVKDKR